MENLDLVVDKIHRTGSVSSVTRSLITTTYDGKRKLSTLLSTPIWKIEWEPEYRIENGRVIPVEQYVFEVDGQKVMRFADATALVLKKHKVTVKGEHKQRYLKQAEAILAGKAPLKEATANTAQ